MANNALKILLVSTDPDPVRVLREDLVKGRDLPFELIQAEDFFTVQDAFDKHELHLIVLDLSVSQKQGLEQLDQVCREAGGIPILVLIDPPDDDLGTQSIKRGAHEYFFKRRVLADASSLIDRIRYTLERHILLGDARVM